MSLTFYEAGFTVLGQQVEGSARRWATLTVTLIAGLASTVFVLLITALLGHGGLHMALAGMLLLVGLPVWWVVPDRGAAQVTSHLCRLFSRSAFSGLVWAFTLSQIVTVGVGLQLAPLLLAPDHSPAVAADLTGLMGLVAWPGRVIYAPLLQRLGGQTLTGGLLGLLGTGTGLLHSSASWPLTALGTMLFGLASGALTLARSELLVAWCPPAQFGTVNGRLALSLWHRR